MLVALGFENDHSGKSGRAVQLDAADMMVRHEIIIPMSLPGSFSSLGS